MFDIHSMFIVQHAQLYEKHPKLSRALIKLGRCLWMEKEFKAFEAQAKWQDRIELIQQGFDYIDFDFTLSEQSLANIPRTGRAVIVANHPLGYLDGIGLLKTLHAIRPDVKLVINKSLHILLGMQDYTIAVDNVSGAISKQSLKQIYQQLDDDGVVIIFPAGFVSQLSRQGVADFAWNSSFLRFAEQKNAPVIPVFIDGQNSYSYYLLTIVCRPFFKLSLLFREALQVKLLREMFSRHRHQRLAIVVGQALSYEQLAVIGDKTARLQYVREQLYALKKTI